MTMPAIHRILTSTALCLAAVGLSSCVTTVHRYAWNRAKVIDEAYWVQDEKNIELYRVGDTVYAKGFIGPARGGQATDDIPARVYFTHGGAGPCFNPIEEQGRPVYIRVRDGYTKLRKDATSLYASSSGKNAGNVLYVHWYAPPYSFHLTELPAGAVRLTEHGSTGSGIEESDGYKPHTDAHKYYAYPLGALIAVGVDAPLTLAGNALLLGGLAATIPCAGIFAVYEACSQNSPEEKSTTEPTPQPQSSPST